jgi:hypothetical protein
MVTFQPNPMVDKKNTNMVELIKEWLARRHPDWAAVGQPKHAKKGMTDSQAAQQR